MCGHLQTVMMDCHRTCCTTCGLVLKTTYNPSEMQLYNDFLKEHLVIPYTRIKRFRYLLESILFGWEHSDDKIMLKLLSTHKDEIHCVYDIFYIMIHSKLTDKRYCSLHLFMTCFAPHLVLTPDERYMDSLRKQNAIERTFKKIEHALTFTAQTFLNYRFVLDVLLQKFGLDEFRLFIKPLKCPKRLLSNIRKLNACKITLSDGRLLEVPETFLMSPKSLFLSMGPRD